MSANEKPTAGLSLDLDNLWSYKKIYGDAGWKNYPSYLKAFVPQVLDILDRHELKITFFIVGRDAAMPENEEVLRMITSRGHHAGNHSFSHEPWLHLYTKEDLKREVILAEEQICRVTGEKPIGFRGPGYSYTPGLMEILARQGYLYDASMHPSSVAPMARAYYFRHAGLDEEEKRKRLNGCGSFREALRPVKPFYWRLTSGTNFLEIPVTTTPIIKTPFHISYLLCLSQYSESLMAGYLKFAITMCRMTSTEPSFLLHPLDIISREQCPELDFFPGMNISSEKKRRVFEYVLNELKKHFHLVSLNTYAKMILERRGIRVIPAF